MSLSSLSFLVFYSGRNVTYNGEEDFGLACLANLKTTTTVSTIFDLWMSHGFVDTLVLIINFLNEAWCQCMLFWGCLRFMKFLAIHGHLTPMPT